MMKSMEIKAVGVPEIFNYEGNRVRVVMRDGEPWFVAADACHILGITNTTVALHNVDDKDRAKLNIGQRGEVNVISESGLYVLIMTSRKPLARVFRRWVTSEVLPTIRKTGKYEVTAPAFAVPTNFADALKLAWEQEVKIQEQKVVLFQQQAKITVMVPKAEACDNYLNARGGKTLTKFAKDLRGFELGPRKLFKILRGMGILYKHCTSPLQKYINCGWFYTLAGVYNGHTGSTTYITAQGEICIRKMLIDAGYLRLAA